MDSDKQKKTQIAKFKAAAREIGADQTEEDFDRLVRKLARAGRPESVSKPDIKK